MRQRAGLGNSFAKILANLRDGRGFVGRGGSQLSRQNLRRQRNRQQVLAQPVVQVLSDAPLFSGGSIEDLAFQALSLTQVADDASENPAIAEVRFAHREVDGKDGPI